LKAIICKNALGYIGDKGRLLWHSKEELQHFANLTANSALLVGYNTFKSLPTLKNRTIHVDPRYGYFHDLDCIDWCIGGAKTYKKYAHLFTELHTSWIVDNFDKGDAYMPPFIGINKDCKVFNYEFNEIWDIKNIVIDAHTFVVSWEQNGAAKRTSFKLLYDCIDLEKKLIKIQQNLTQCKQSIINTPNCLKRY
jgi:hypothetical protein